MENAKVEAIPATKNNEEKVLKFMAENGSITAAEMAEKIGVIEKTVKRIIKQLQEENKIERTGSKKTGDWIIIK